MTSQMFGHNKIRNFLIANIFIDKLGGFGHCESITGDRLNFLKVTNIASR